MRVGISFKIMVLISWPVVSNPDCKPITPEARNLRLHTLALFLD